MKLAFLELKKLEEVSLDDVLHTFGIPHDWVLFELYRDERRFSGCCGELDYDSYKKEKLNLKKSEVIPLLIDVFKRDDDMIRFLLEWAKA